MFCKSRTWVVLAAAWSWAGKAEPSLFQCTVPKQTSADLNPFRPITPRAGWSIPYQYAGTWLFLWVWTEGKLMGEALVSSEISLAVSTGIFTLQFSSVAQSCLTLCNPTNRSLPGLPVHHQLPEFTQLMSIESVMPSSHLILGRPLFLLPPISPSIRVFSNESTLRMRWPTLKFYYFGKF